MTSECRCTLGFKRKGVGSDGENINPSQSLSLPGGPTPFVFVPTVFPPQQPKGTKAVDFLFL